MWYVFDEHKNLADKDNLPVIYTAGETYIFDDIETYCLLGTADSDRPLFVDKNHDLSYYFAGSDFLDKRESSTVINTTNKYGYEWGGYGTETGIQDTSIGAGLNNTNQLISKNLQPRTSGWWVVWNKINEFRQSHSDKWFVPSEDELNLIYENRSNLSNLSLSTNAYYWSSSEISSSYAYGRDFSGGYRVDTFKYFHYFRARLCYTL